MEREGICHALLLVGHGDKVINAVASLHRRKVVDTTVCFVDCRQRHCPRQHRPWDKRLHLALQCAGELRKSVSNDAEVVPRD